MPPRRSRNAPWPLLFIFLSLVAAIAGSGYFFYQQQKKAVIRDGTSQLQAIADLKAGEIRQWLDERLGDANLIARNPLLNDELAPLLLSHKSLAGESGIRKWMAALQRYYHYENVLLLDGQGRVLLAGSPKGAAIGREGRELLERTRRGQVAMLSDLHMNPQIPYRHIDIAAPLSAGEEVLGFVILRIDPAKFLYPLIQSWPTPSPSAETILVRREGADVLFLNELRHRKGTSMTLRLPMASPNLPAALAVSGKTGAITGRDYRGVAVWSVSRPVAGTSWFIVAKIDREEVERPFRRSALAIFLVALLLVLAAALLILILWQRQNAEFRLHLLELHQESEEKFRQVFETANVGKSITQLSGEINVNQAFCAMLGYGQEELQQKKWQEITPSDEIEATQKILEPILQGRENSTRFNKRYIHKNGSIIWADVSVAIRRDAAGKPLHFITTVVDITAHKRAEDTLREIIDNAPFGAHLYELRPGGRLVFVGANRAADTILGVDNRKFVGKAIEEAFPPLGQTDIPDAYRRAAARGERFDSEQVEFAEGGIRGAFEVHAFQTSPNRMATFFFDITERKQAEAKLQREQALYMDLVNALPAGMYRLRVRPDVKWSADNWRAQMGSQYAIDFVSDRFCEITGIDRREFIADPGLIPDRIHPDDSLEFSRKNAAAVLSLSTFSWEGRMIVPGKGATWIRFESIPRPLENGEVIWTGIVNDISERKRTELDLQILSSRNQAILEAVPDIIMEVDANKVYSWANHAGIDFFGADVIGRQASFYFLGEQDTYQQVQPIFNGQEEVIYVESWQRRRDGARRLLAWWCRVLKDKAGNVTGVLSSARDTTDLKLAENEIRQLNDELELRVQQRTAQLQAANKELEAFSYSVSHDLRAPLRAIDGFSRIVLEEYAPKLDDEGRRLLGVITANTGKMGQLIDDLLAFSRLSRQQMAFTSIDLAALAQSIFSDLKHLEKGRTIDFKAGALPAAHGDPSMLRQVLQNLLANAIKFTRPRPRARIELSGSVEKGETVYQVRDNGVGFEMAYADKLFGVFQRLHDSTEFEGTGVGLAIVQRIILRHGGRLWAESSARGATFYFSLPAEPGSMVETPSPATVCE